MLSTQNIGFQSFQKSKNQELGENIILDCYFSFKSYAIAAIHPF